VPLGPGVARRPCGLRSGGEAGQDGGEAEVALQHRREGLGKINGKIPLVTLWLCQNSY